MNAVVQILAELPRETLIRVRRVEFPDAVAQDDDRLRARLVDHYGEKLSRFLNVLTRGELDELADALGVDTGGGIGELRARLWTHGAVLEADGDHYLGTRLQPVPIVLGGKLVHLAHGSGSAPLAPTLPRGVPDPRPAHVAPEPTSVEDLLGAADRLIGVRLGRSDVDKGRFGNRVAELLGVVELGHAEPDFRGEIEIKTVPVVRDRSGYWRVKEDPAVGMRDGNPVAKLKKVLWVARVADEDDSPVLSWYYQTWDDHIAGLARQYLHIRPKGGRGATTKGWYLHKHFFRESGFLESLNG